MENHVFTTLTPLLWSVIRPLGQVRRGVPVVPTTNYNQREGAWTREPSRGTGSQQLIDDVDVKGMGLKC